MKPYSCVVCGKELTNGSDTYGDIGLEMCWECYSSLFEDMVLTPIGCGYFKEYHGDHVLKQMIMNGYQESAKDDPRAYNHEVD